MSSWLDRLRYRRLRVPEEDGTALVDPPWEDMPGLIEENVRRRANHDYDFQGRSLADLSRQARRELVLEARRWTGAYRDVDRTSADSDGLIFMAGHQPQLVHPGVWFKNFALDRLARRHGAVAVNLLVDNDTVRSTSLRVPGGSPDAPEVIDISFDAVRSPIPYEERSIADWACFESFGRRVADRLGTLVPDSMVEDYWSRVVRRGRETENLGASLAQSRHELEGRWGLSTLEVPSSRVCRSGPFAWFVAHLVANLPRLWRIHNEIIGEFRRANRIRSAAHPVPDLTEDGEWLEAPFWIWTVDDPRRRPLFVRRRGDGIELSNRRGLGLELPLSADATADRAVERLKAASTSGVKIRCRTLMTTLWARLMLGDVFLHGIGGAKYDQVTDALIERFFGLKPPTFFTLSATLHLPILRRPVDLRDERSIQRQIRELEFHPERYLDRADVPVDGELAALVAEKTRWIRTPKTRENAKTRDEHLRRVNEALQPWLTAQRERLLVLQRENARARQAEAILTHREYATCLYPEETVRRGLADLVG